MSRKEEDYQVLPIPMNTEFDFNIGSYTFQIKNLAEGIVIGGTIGLLLYLFCKKFSIPYGTAITIVLFGALGGAYLGIKGINGETVPGYLFNILKFHKNRRITHYNPRIKDEKRFFTEETDDDDYVIPRERLEALYRKVVAKADMENAKNNLQKEELDTSYMFFEDDISYLGKPVELMTKAEKRKLARQLKKKARLEAKQRKKELKDARKKKKIAGIR